MARILLGGKMRYFKLEDGNYIGVEDNEDLTPYEGLEMLTGEEVQAALTVPKTEEQIFAYNNEIRNTLMSEASIAISTLSDIIEFDANVSDGTQALLGQWRLYRINLMKVDLTVEDPEYPEKPEGI